MALSRWHRLADRALAGDAIAREDALAVLRAPQDELPDVLDAAFQVRLHHHGRFVKIHILLNAKSGACPEDCGFCAQSARAPSGVRTTGLLAPEKIVEAGRRAAAAGAWKFCLATAMRGPSDQDLDGVCAAVRELKATTRVRVCTSLGMLGPGQAKRLADAGVDRFNHNLETSARHFPRVCATHTHEDRVRTVREVQAAGMEACCGGIVGLGEEDSDVVDLAFAVRDLGVTSIPVNFLDPRPGTPLAGRPRIRPAYALKALAMFRLVNPSRDIRAAAGREVTLGPLQPQALLPANSIFSDGYLTTGGRSAAEDREMVRDFGFEVA